MENISTTTYQEGVKSDARQNFFGHKATVNHEYIPQGQKVNQH
jgi:hypothetical protein